MKKDDAISVIKDRVRMYIDFNEKRKLEHMEYDRRYRIARTSISELQGMLSLMYTLNVIDDDEWDELYTLINSIDINI